MTAAPVLSRRMKSLERKVATAQRPVRSADTLAESAVQTATGRAPAATRGTSVPFGRLPVRFVNAVLGAALICALTSAPGVSDGGLLIARAYAQSKHQSPIESARKTIDTLINRLRGRDMPDGIVKTNGRIEATEVDIAAKYPGRLVKLTVDEGD